MPQVLPLILRLTEDILSNGNAASLPALPRMIFVVHGSVTIDAAAIAERGFKADEAYSGEGAVTLKAGPRRRHALALGVGDRPAARRRVPWHGHPRKTCRARSKHCPRASCCCAATAWRFRRAAAPFCTGIKAPASRCVFEGAHPHRYPRHVDVLRPGRRLVRDRPRPVFAQAADRPTRFIRVMILPRALIWAKARSNISTKRTRRSRSRRAYKIFVDMPLTVIPAERSESRNP